MQVGALNSGLPMQKLGITSVTMVYKIMSLVKTPEGKCREKNEFQTRPEGH